MPPPTHTATVASRRILAEGVVELRIQPEEPLPSWRAGQWISLQLPVGERPPHIRAYSLAAPPTPSGEMVMCLDRVPGGLASAYLWDVEPGTPLTYAGPLGNFTLPEDRARPLVMVARFTGIVPFRAMLLELLAEPTGADATLVYTSASATEMAYLDELRLLAAQEGWFRLLETVDRSDAGWCGEVGPAEAVMDAHVDLAAHPAVMVCGKREFVLPLRGWLMERGYERREIRCEMYD